MQNTVKSSLFCIGKKALALALCLVMAVSLLPTTAFAATEVASGTCGDNLTWTLDSDGVLTISGTGEMWNFSGRRSGNESPWLERSDIKAIKISKGVTSIGDWAFWGNYELKSVYVPDGVTYIGDFAFCICGKLTDFNIPSTVTYIGESAFCSCSITNGVIPEGVEYIGDEAFSYCKSIENVVVASSVKYLGKKAFKRCEQLTSATIGASNIGENAFERCEKLTSATIGASNIGENAFQGCDKLKSVTIEAGTIGKNAFAWLPNLDTVILHDGVKEIGDYAFSGSGLKNITLCYGVESIGNGAFAGCGSLTNFVIPNSVKYIGDEAFAECRSITGITIPDSVTYIGKGAFCWCDCLESIVLSKNITSINTYTFQLCSSLKNIVIPDNVTRIEDAAFQYCGLSSVTIPDSVVTIGKRAFECGVTVDLDLYETLTDVYFGGDQAKWNKIDIGEINGPLLKATIHYNSKGPNTADEKGFRDVADGAWYFDSVNYVVEKGLMGGYSETTFAPNDSTTRGMLMTIIARLAGTDTSGGATWYEKGMQWAVKNGISDGSSPEANITREQLITMLYRYAGNPTVRGKLSASNAAGVSDYALTAMTWAVNNGILVGTDGGSLNPQSTATRAEVATILMRFCENVK